MYYVNKYQTHQIFYWVECMANDTGNFYAIVGMRGSGKSTLIKELYLKLKESIQIDRNFVFSPFEPDMPFYSDFIPKEDIRESCSLDDLQEMINYMDCNKHHKICVILDDCIYYKQSKHPILNTFLAKGKENNIICMIAIQYGYMQFPLFDYIFLFDDQYMTEQKRKYDYYAKQYFVDANEFRRILYMVRSELYVCLCVDNKNERLFCYKAAKPEDPPIIPCEKGPKIYIKKVLPTRQII